jgi:hypothetical protein
MRDHESIFHFDFRQRSWFVARLTSLGGLGNHVSYGCAAVWVAGILASGGLASRVLASANGRGMTLGFVALGLWILNLIGALVFAFRHSIGDRFFWASAAILLV